MTYRIAKIVSIPNLSSAQFEYSIAILQDSLDMEVFPLQGIQLSSPISLQLLYPLFSPVHFIFCAFFFRHQFFRCYSFFCDSDECIIDFFIVV